MKKNIVSLWHALAEKTCQMKTERSLKPRYQIVTCFFQRIGFKIVGVDLHFKLLLLHFVEHSVGMFRRARCSCRAHSGNP